MIYRVEYIDNGKGKSKKLAHPVKDRKALMALRDSKKNHGFLEKARNGDAEAKAKLLQLAYNIGYVEGLLAGCKSIGSYFFYDVDCYDVAQTAAFKEVILSKKDAIGLMMLEKSAGGGYHLVCRRVPHTTILENQVRVSLELKIEMDTGAHDLQRVVYSTSGSAEDLIYLDDALFEEPMSEEECEKEYLLLKEREKKKLEQVPPGAKKSNKHYRPWEEVEAGDTQGSGNSVTSQATSQKFQTPSVAEATERTRFIFDCCMKEAGLELHHLHVKGGRHDALKSILSVGATQLLKKPELLGVLQEKMPDNWQDDNIQRLVSDFYENYTDPSKKMTVFERKVFSQSLKLEEGRTLGTGATVISQTIQTPSAPEMPKRLPKLITLLTSKTPDVYKAAVAHAVFPPLATHLCEVRFCYTDNVEHEATLMNCLMAYTGSGKGCIDEPIRRIMADIQRRDDENTRREDEWKKDCQKKGANKDKQMRPEGLVIQIIDPDMTKPALVTRMHEAEEHFVYVKLNELDLFEQLKGQTGKQHFQLMCLAFDPNSEYGQTRVGTQSVTARPKCRFNWNACTTIQKGIKFFGRVLTDGPISRINFCTIPEQEIGAEQPIYGQYDLAFDEALKPYIDNLVAARGLIDCPQAFRLAKKMQEEVAEFARLSQDEIYWNLSHRAVVIAWLKACVLYVANGRKWEKTIEDFIRWSLNYDLWCKMAFFAAAIEASNNAGERIGTRGPRSLLELLPDVFTTEDAKRIRKQQGKSVENTGRMVSQWKTRGYILQLTVDSFQKAPKFNHLKGNDHDRSND